MNPIPRYSLRSTAQMLYSDIPRIIDTLDRRFAIAPPRADEPIAQFRQLLCSRALASLFYTLLQCGVTQIVLPRLHPHPIERCCEVLSASITALQAAGYHTLLPMSPPHSLPPRAAKEAMAGPPALYALLLVIHSLPEDAQTIHPDRRKPLREDAQVTQSLMSLLPEASRG